MECSTIVYTAIPTPNFYVVQATAVLIPLIDIYQFATSYSHINTCPRSYILSDAFGPFSSSTSNFFILDWTNPGTASSILGVNGMYTG